MPAGCSHSRRVLHLGLTNLIRPSSSSPRLTPMTSPILDCRPQLILPDTDLSLMCHGPTRIWMSSPVLHGKDAEDCSLANDRYGGANSGRPTSGCDRLRRYVEGVVSDPKRPFATSRGPAYWRRDYDRYQFDRFLRDRWYAASAGHVGFARVDTHIYCGR